MQRWTHRLEDGLEHNIRLVIAKSALGLNSSGADYRVPLTIGAQFGATYSAQGWGQAMTMLTCAANIHERLNDEDRPPSAVPGTQAGCIRVRRQATQVPGGPPAHGRNQAGGLQGLVPKFHRSEGRRGRGTVPADGDRPRHLPARHRGYGIRGCHGQDIPRRGPHSRLLQQGVRDSRPHRLGTRGPYPDQSGAWHGLREAERGVELLAQPDRPVVAGMGGARRASRSMGAGSGVYVAPGTTRTRLSASS